MNPEFAFSLYDLDWDLFSTHIDAHVHRVPVIGETGIKSTVCGPGKIQDSRYMRKQLLC